MNRMNRFKTLRIALLIASLAIGGAITHYFLSSKNTGPVYSYQDSTDREQVKAIFKGDWYWMSNREWDSQITDFVLKTNSPNEYEPRYFGKMTIKVLKENDNVIGFITYYMLSFYEGKILFLAIAPEHRGKRYADKLLNVAVDDLFKRGATQIRLDTRTDNAPARKLYMRYGFEQIPPWEDEGFVHYLLRKSSVQ